MSKHSKRLEKIEQRLKPILNPPFPARPQHTLQDAMAIIMGLYDVGVLPDNPPPQWTQAELDAAKRVKELIDTARARKAEQHEA